MCHTSAVAISTQPVGATPRASRITSPVARRSSVLVGVDAFGDPPFLYAYEKTCLYNCRSLDAVAAGRMQARPAA